MKLILAVLLIALASPAMASHDKITECHDVDRALTYLRTANRDLVVKHHMTGPEATAFIVLFNAEAPITAYVGDEVAIYWDPTMPTGAVYILVLHQGCAFSGSPASPRMVERLMGHPL